MDVCSNVLSWTLIYLGFITCKKSTIPGINNARKMDQGLNLQASMKLKEKLQNPLLNTAFHMVKGKEEGGGESKLLHAS